MKVDSPSDPAAPRGFSAPQVLGLVALAILLTGGTTGWFVRTYVYPAPFEPVTLSQTERSTLGSKLRALGVDPEAVLPAVTRDAFDANGRLVPERYVEDPSRREIEISERELNAMLASNPDFARRFAIDLSGRLASAKLLVPVDPDMPVFGGRTLRFTAGVELDYRKGRPVVILRGVSVMGVPIPSAWLGRLEEREPGGGIRGRSRLLEELRRRRGADRDPRRRAVRQAEGVSAARVAHPVVRREPDLGHEPEVRADLELERFEGPPRGCRARGRLRFIRSRSLEQNR